MKNLNLLENILLRNPSLKNIPNYKEVVLLFHKIRYFFGIFFDMAFPQRMFFKLRYFRSTIFSVAIFSIGIFSFYSPCIQHILDLHTIQQLAQNAFLVDRKVPCFCHQCTQSMTGSFLSSGSERGIQFRPTLCTHSLQCRSQRGTESRTSGRNASSGDQPRSRGHFQHHRSKLEVMGFITRSTR